MLSALAPGAKRASGETGDDAIELGQVGATAVVALADGAGYAKRGGYGAKLATGSAVEFLCEQLEGAQTTSLRTVLTRAMDEARHTVFMAAKSSSQDESPIEPGDLATTLTVAVFGPKEVGIASIGDGINVLRRVDGELALAAMAPDTEIANQTDFLTGPNLAAKTEVEIHPASEIESLLLSSDGLDSQLVDRREEERWPQHASVSSLLNAPVLEGWTPQEFESLLNSDLIRRHSDDDLSLALVRRVDPPGPGSLQEGRLTLTPAEEVRPGCQTWTVNGCSSLIAMAPDPPLPPGEGIAPRGEQIWDRGIRHAPINWPVRRIERGLVLVQRLPREALLLSTAVRRADPVERLEILDGVRAAVDGLHATGLSHGGLSLESFALYPDRTVVLWEPGPGMFAGANREALASLDRAFVSGLGDGRSDEGNSSPPGDEA